MSTKIHPDGRRTVVHTSKHQTEQQADFLRRSGGKDGEAMAQRYLARSAEAEEEAHQAEHARMVAWHDKMAAQGIETEVETPPAVKPDTIVFTAPAGTHARWRQRSKAVGMPLGEWVREQVDRPSNRIMGEGCPRCDSVVLAYDHGSWMCAQCGLTR